MERPPHQLMKTKIHRSLFAFCSAAALAGVVATSSGCLAVAAGAGTGAAVAYVRGQLETNLAASFDRSERAANEALQQLGLAKVNEKRDALVAIINARNAEDKKIEIRLDNVGQNLTKLRIRVGIFGDESLSMAIHDKIKANL